MGFRFSTELLKGRARTVSRSENGAMNKFTAFPNANYNDRGAATAEYAIATVAAAGFAGLLALVLKSGPIQTMLTSLISGALSVVGQ
jgi:hypothetical protein